MKREHQLTYSSYKHPELFFRKKVYPPHGSKSEIKL